ncbi:hypothetical protein [Sediminicoccus sp. KRV36]|uniref:hypothetical protein n=1 Tax=Sediminicoccus sp. KRV36 TaxID=3133721 RepID=UPI00200C7842|nr:hypothetical protein [Sediminicoccus rosea]UPY36132.1 hypothetical protein LHU95_18220 [Sediminicoccus rosea]
MRGPIHLPMLRRRPLTATQICKLPEQAPNAAAFYEPPHGGDPELSAAAAMRPADEHESAAAA